MCTAQGPRLDSNRGTGSGGGPIVAPSAKSKQFRIIHLPLPLGTGNEQPQEHGVTEHPEDDRRACRYRSMNGYGIFKYCTVLDSKL
jgi:hypothetical protein